MQECVSHLTHNVTAAPGQKSLVGRSKWCQERIWLQLYGRWRVFQSTDEEIICVLKCFSHLFTTAPSTWRGCVLMLLLLFSLDELHQIAVLASRCLGQSSWTIISECENVALFARHTIKFIDFNNLLFTQHDRTERFSLCGINLGPDFLLREEMLVLRLDQLKSTGPSRPDSRICVCLSLKFLFLDVNKRCRSKEPERNKSKHHDELPGANLTSTSSICCLFDATENDSDSEIFMLCSTESKTNPREKKKKKRIPSGDYLRRLAAKMNFI